MFDRLKFCPQITAETDLSNRPQEEEEEETMKAKYFNDTLVDMDLLNRTSSSLRHDAATQESVANDDVDELLNLLQVTPAHFQR
jgi:hypothetical protein